MFVYNYEIDKIAASMAAPLTRLLNVLDKSHDLHWKYPGFISVKYRCQMFENSAATEYLKL